MRIQKRPFLVILALTAAGVVAAFVILCREAVLESWYLYRFHAGVAGERRAAAAKLADLRSVRAVPVLLEHYERSSCDPKEEHAGAIIARLDAERMERLALLLRRQSPGRVLLLAQVHRRARAVTESEDGEIDPPVPSLGASFVPVLRSSLGNENEGLRRWAAEELSRIGADAGAAEDDLRRATEDPSDLVRLWARIALEAINTARQLGHEAQHGSSRANGL